MTMGLFFNSGNDAIIAKPIDIPAVAARCPSARGHPRSSASPWRGTKRSPAACPSCRWRSWCRAGSVRGNRAGICRRRPHIRPAHARRRQRAAHGIDGVIVQPVKFLRRAAASSRCWPRSTISQYQLFHFCTPVFLHAMFRPLINQFRPLRIVLRRISPAGVNLVVFRAGLPAVLIRLWLGDSSLGMKPISHVWFGGRVEVGVENPVQDGPVVNRPAFGVLARKCPLNPISTRACRRPMFSRLCVRKKTCLRPKPAEFRQQFFAVLHIGVVRLVRAEETPDGTQRAFGIGRVHANSYWKVIPLWRRMAASTSIRQKLTNSAKIPMNASLFFVIVAGKYSWRRLAGDHLNQGLMPALLRPDPMQHRF